MHSHSPQPGPSPMHACTPTVASGQSQARSWPAEHGDSPLGVAQAATTHMHTATAARLNMAGHPLLAAVLTSQAYWNLTRVPDRPCPAAEPCPCDRDPRSAPHALHGSIVRHPRTLSRQGLRSLEQAAPSSMLNAVRGAAHPPQDNDRLDSGRHRQEGPSATGSLPETLNWLARCRDAAQHRQGGEHLQCTSNQRPVIAVIVVIHIPGQLKLRDQPDRDPDTCNLGQLRNVHN